METTYETSIFEEEKVTIVYGGFWERLGAMILDYLILLPLYFVNMYNVYHWRSVAVMLVISLISLSYKPLFEYLNSATPGKKAVGLVITNYRYEKPNLTNILLRNCFHIGLALISVIGTLIINGGVEVHSQAITDMNSVPKGTVNTLMLSFSLMLVYLVDAVVLIIDKKNRSLHDMIGKTYVIRK